MQSAKATLEQLRLHNRRLVLRAIFTGAATTRAELATHTGLTKPTVSNLIGELLNDGLVSERGPGRSSGSGGKRPTLLEFESDSRQVIGLSAADGALLGVLSNLAGVRSALHRLELGPSDHARGPELTGALLQACASLVAQLDAPLECIGIGLPGHEGAEATQVLRREFGVNVYLGNQAELTALGQLAFAGLSASAVSAPPAQVAPVARRLVTLLADDRVEIGVCLASGAVHYGSDISSLVTWRGGSPPPGDELALLELRRAASRGDGDASREVDSVARALTEPLAWILATLVPDEVSIGGRLSALGEPLLAALAEQVGSRVGPLPRLSLAYSAQLGAMGAVALAVQAELGVLRPE